MTDHLTNPFLSLPYESAMQDLGDQYYDQVAAADFPSHILRFRNDALLPLVGIQPELTLDEHFIEAFGKFQSLTPFLASIILFWEMVAVFSTVKLGVLMANYTILVRKDRDGPPILVMLTVG